MTQKLSELVNRYSKLDYELRLLRRNIENRYCKKHKVNIGWIRPLKHIVEYPGISLWCLAVHLNISSPAATQMIQTMVKNNLIYIEKGKDKRSIELYPTKKGEFLNEEIWQ